MNKVPLVSIVTAIYNAEEFLEETIQSVLDQNFSDWELLLVDDFSTDHSLKIITKFTGDKRIHALTMPEGQGGSAANTRNFGIDQAKGRYITFLDADDTWKPNFLSSQLSFMKEKQCAFAFSSFFWRAANKDKEYIVPARVTYHDTLKTNSITCLTAIYDREQIGVFYMPEDATKREDFACFLNILKKTKYAYGNPEVLAMYRLHNQSVSSRKTKMIKWQWRVYRKIEHLSFFKSVYYLFCWGFNGIKKHGDLRRKSKKAKNNHG